MSEVDETASNQSKTNKTAALSTNGSRGTGTAAEGAKDNPKHRVQWSPENEGILVEWCDVAMCYKWMHTRSQQMYSRWHAWFTIPAIILSTVSGTASFAQTSLPTSYQAYSPMVIGGVNIFVGIFATIQQYLQISELNEAYRVSAISWDKYARNIRIELAKAPLERAEAYAFLKYSRDEFDRLMETSPSILPKVVNEFMQQFSGEASVAAFADKLKQDRFQQLFKPDICGIIISAEEKRHPWFLSTDSLDYEGAEAAASAAATAAEAEAVAAAAVEETEELERQLREDERKLIEQERQLREEERRREAEERNRLAEQLRIHQEADEERLRQAAAERLLAQQIEELRIQQEAEDLRIEKEEQIRLFIQQFVENVGREPFPEEIVLEQV